MDGGRFVKVKQFQRPYAPRSSVWIQSFPKPLLANKIRGTHTGFKERHPPLEFGRNDIICCARAKFPSFVYHGVLPLTNTLKLTEKI